LSEEGAAVPSLVGVTFRRALASAWYFPLVGVGFSLVYATIVLAIPHGGPNALANGFPLVGPLYLVFGSGGALVVFADDRARGVFEYLIAYGVRPSTLFRSTLVANLALASIVLGASLGIVYGSAWALGATLTWSVLELVVFYAIPMTYGGAVFTVMLGMIWSALSSPKAGNNSPVGFAPLLGVAPVLLVLLAAELLPGNDVYWLGTTAAAALLATAALVTALSDRVMVRERFLSPM
jgi:hypothetical protein